MAEARMAVSELRVPPTLEEGRDSWKDVYHEVRKSVKRRYYRTRNSVRNGTWPTSSNNLLAAFSVCFALLAVEPQTTARLNQWLWSLAPLLYLPTGTPKWFEAVLIAGIVAGTFFVILMTLRQYILRILLSYRGWLYEDFKKTSMKTVIWAIAVKMTSGYLPSLYSCQRSLPRLPVPSLQTTLEKLLVSLKPLCDKEELDQLTKEAEEFKRGIGSKLQRTLQLRSWWAPNYVSDWWEKYVYLMTRSPLPINSNYYGMDQSYWTPTKHRTVRAATILYHVLSFKRLIDREELQPLVLRGTIPICMAQYERLFSSYRIPGEEVDELKHYDSSESRHIIVTYKGLYYSFDVYDSRNQILCPSRLQTLFDWIIKDVQSRNNEKDENDVRSIASLTTLPRREWAGLRKKYFSSGQNRETMDLLQRAILLVTLSDASPSTLGEKARILFHADGRTIWFDKSVNVAFFNNGQCGLNVEHSMADAPVMAHCWEYALTREVMEKWYTEDETCMPMPKSFREGKFKNPNRLKWSVCPDLGFQILKAVEFAQKNNEDLDLVIADHAQWGKGAVKKCGVSPDAFVQLALQLAYFKDAGKFAQTYEASMTRLYNNGRTETVRSCTQEAADFVRAMMENNRTAEEKIKLLRAAAKQHQQLYRDSMNGKGIDRHLFALYVACKGLGHQSPFLEKILMRPWTLSTSQQPQQQLNDVPDSNYKLFYDKVSPGGGFGPVSDDGYGVSYMLPNDHKIFFHVTSKHSSPATSSTRFVENIFQSLEEIRSLFDTPCVSGSESSESDKTK